MATYQPPPAPAYQAPPMPYQAPPSPAWYPPRQQTQQPPQQYAPPPYNQGQMDRGATANATRDLINLVTRREHGQGYGYDDRPRRRDSSRRTRSRSPVQRGRNGLPARHRERDYGNRRDRGNADPVDKSQKPCWFFHKGNCKNGADCPFKHDAAAGKKKKSSNDDDKMDGIESTGQKTTAKNGRAAKPVIVDNDSKRESAASCVQNTQPANSGGAVNNGNGANHGTNDEGTRESAESLMNNLPSAPANNGGAVNNGNGANLGTNNEGTRESAASHMNNLPPAPANNGSAASNSNDANHGTNQNGTRERAQSFLSNLPPLNNGSAASNAKTDARAALKSLGWSEEQINQSLRQAAEEDEEDEEPRGRQYGRRNAENGTATAAAPARPETDPNGMDCSPNTSDLIPRPNDSSALASAAPQAGTAELDKKVEEVQAQLPNAYQGLFGTPNYWSQFLQMVADRFTSQHQQQEQPQGAQGLPAPDPRPEANPPLPRDGGEYSTGQFEENLPPLEDGEDDDLMEDGVA